MSEIMQHRHEKSKDRYKLLLRSISDPKLYFIIALFSGEAMPAFFPISSGWMYIFGFCGLIMLLTQNRTKVRKRVSVVLVIYAIVLLRNITFNLDTLKYYELPNLCTALIMLLINCVFYKDGDIDQIGKYIFAYSVVLSAMGVIKFLQNPNQRLAVFGGPNGYYKITLLFETLCFYRYLKTRKRRFIFGAVLGLVLCIATGSKGGIVSMIVILGLELFYFVFNAGEQRRIIINRMIQITVIFIVGYLVVVKLLDRIPGLSVMFSRASSFISSDSLSNLTSVNARTNLIRMGIEFFKESPIWGKGARYTYIYTNGAQPYSHNIIIEFLSEQGLIGTIPLLIFLITIISQTIKYSLKDQRLFCLFLCFSVYFSGSLFSGNILDSKPIFVFGIMMYNCVQNIRYKQFISRRVKNA